MEGWAGRGIGGSGWEGCGGGGVGVCECERGRVGDLFVWGESGDEEGLDWSFCVSTTLNSGKSEGIRTLWRSPGAVVEEGEIQVVVHTTIRSKHPDLWSSHIIGFRCSRSQRQYMASLQTIWQALSRVCDDAISGSGGDCQRLNAAILSYVEDECLAREYIVVE